MSPSSRRAWIEILLYSLTSVAKRVALLAEGVDRNFDLLAQMERLIGVALLAEGVDRNKKTPQPKTVGERRPPRGGRG